MAYPAQADLRIGNIAKAKMVRAAFAKCEGGPQDQGTVDSVMN